MKTEESAEKVRGHNKNLEKDDQSSVDIISP